MSQAGRPEGGNSDPAYLLLSRSIVAKLQFSDLIVPIAEIAWKGLKRKELAKQLPRTAVIRVVVLRGGLSGDPEEFSRALLALGVQAGPRSRRGLHRFPDGRCRSGRGDAGEEDAQAEEEYPMNSFQEIYDSLPDSEKDRIMAHLHAALKWRGWARSSDEEGREMLLAAIDTIAEIFVANGHKIRKYD
jgi:hypothetical protein